MLSSTIALLCYIREGFLTSLTKTLQKHVSVSAASRDGQEENLEFSMKRVSTDYCDIIRNVLSVESILSFLFI